ncbi:MAG TPA: maltose ABC transporter permease MalF [Candidatus Limnocylindrales bacterium]|nr:maltose ABC transporter permease MalF [Candidatus Limnocylindrales bacterium]
MTGGQQEAPRSGASSPVASLIGRLVALAFIDAIALVFAYSFYSGGLALAAVMLLVVTGAINIVFLVPGLYPLRWISPGVFLLVLMVVYPVMFTVYAAFTNYGAEHILSKQQVIDRLERQFYTPDDQASLTWRAYRSPGGGFLIWLEDATGRELIGDPERGVIPVAEYDADFGPIDPADGLPASINEYGKISRIESFRYLTPISRLEIRDEQAQLRIVSLDRAELGVQRYTYDPARDVIIDHLSQAEYRPREGFFVSDEGVRVLGPGFVDVIGPRNFLRVVDDHRIRDAFFGVFTWNFAFASLSVLLTFALGLALALVFNDQRLPLKGMFRTLAIIPYTIPGFISILVWAGLLNPTFGPINAFLREMVGISPAWFADGTLAKSAILIVNLWLGYPYMLIVTLGALQSIPGDLYEAAEIDGASAYQRFRTITLPLLLVAVAPLLIGSFAFNFNNFAIIELLTAGGPANPGAVTPAGQTDILISYSYRLAFASGRGQDYAFAAAISVFIFALVALITLVNFRISRRLENMI